MSGSPSEATMKMCRRSRYSFVTLPIRNAHATVSRPQEFSATVTICRSFPMFQNLKKAPRLCRRAKRFRLILTAIFHNGTTTKSHPFTDDSGRNDIVNMKAVQDENKMYFYVETAQSLSSPDGGAWMTLFINTSGKEGYDFCINRTAPSNGETAVERIEGEHRIKSGSASIKYAGNRLMISVPKSLLDISGDAEISFKWADNYVDGDIYSFYTRGDAAPYGRLNYTFK